MLIMSQVFLKSFQEGSKKYRLYQYLWQSFGILSRQKSTINSLTFNQHEEYINPNSFISV